MLDKEDKPTYEVIYKFYMPDAHDDLELFKRSQDFFSALHDIYQECRRVYKYDDDASEELCEFAEKIANMCDEAGLWDVP